MALCPHESANNPCPVSDRSNVGFNQSSNDTNLYLQSFPGTISVSLCESAFMYLGIMFMYHGIIVDTHAVDRGHDNFFNFFCNQSYAKAIQALK